MGEILREPFTGTAGVSIGSTNSVFPNGAGVAPVFSNTLVRSGTSAKFTPGGSFGYLTKPITATSNVYQTFYVEMESFTTSGRNWLVMLRNSGTTRALVRVSTAGLVSITNNQTLVSESSTALSLGTDYRMEWDYTGATQTLRVYVGDSTTVLFTLTGATPNLSVNEICAGSQQAATVSFYLDSMVARDDFAPGREIDPGPPSGLTFTRWTGTSEVALVSVKRWDGSAEVDLVTFTVV